jgi:hypothetical protein
MVFARFGRGAILLATPVAHACGECSKRSRIRQAETQGLTGRRQAERDGHLEQDREDPASVLCVVYRSPGMYQLKVRFPCNGLLTLTLTLTFTLGALGGPPCRVAASPRSIALAPTKRFQWHTHVLPSKQVSQPVSQSVSTVVS